MQIFNHQSKINQTNIELRALTNSIILALPYANFTKILKNFWKRNIVDFTPVIGRA